MLDLMDKATADGKCLRCGRPVYPKPAGGFTHDAPPPSKVPARFSPMPKVDMDEPPQEPNQPA